jgi:hypothetical protein
LHSGSKVRGDRAEHETIVYALYGKDQKLAYVSCIGAAASNADA